MKSDLNESPILRFHPAVLGELLEDLPRTIIVCVLCALPLLGCDDNGDEEAPPEEALAPKETFNWSDQAVRFAPPASPWKRHRWQEGGMEGVSFQVPRVPAGRILVAHYHLLHRSHSRSYADGTTLRFAPAAENATIEDVVDRVHFRPQTMPNPDAVQMTSDTRLELGGWPALSVDYTWHDGQHLFLGREVYVLAYGELFVVSLLGGETDLGLFEMVLVSVEFPAPETG
jgi:hypothetical protein